MKELEESNIFTGPTIYLSVTYYYVIAAAVKVIIMIMLVYAIGCTAMLTP